MKHKKQRVVLTLTEIDSENLKADITFEPSIKRFDQEGIPYPTVINVGVRLAALFKNPRFLQEMTKPLTRESGIVQPDHQVVITDAT